MRMIPRKETYWVKSYKKTKTNIRSSKTYQIMIHTKISVKILDEQPIDKELHHEDIILMIIMSRSTKY